MGLNVPKPDFCYNYHNKTTMLSCGVQHSLKFDVAKQNKLLNFQAFLKTLQVAKKRQKFFGILIAIIANTSSWGFSL